MIPVQLIIGNCISVVAVYFTARSSWSKDTWHIYFYQVLQCLTLAVASFFFNSYTGIISLVICAFRNYLAAIGKLDKKWTLICLSLLVLLGIAVNNRGYVGLLLVATNVIYTVGMYLARKELAIKLNIILNLILWMIYEVFIMDIPSVFSDGVGLVVAVASLFRRQPEEAAE